MSEEEKKVVARFKNLGLKTFREEKIKSSDKLSYIEYVILLNLIENQQKEIEILKDNIKVNKWIEDDAGIYKWNVIPKQKIKNLIDENLEKESGEYIVDSNACQCLVRHLIKLV